MTVVRRAKQAGKSSEAFKTIWKNSLDGLLIPKIQLVAVKQERA